MATSAAESLASLAVALCCRRTCGARVTAARCSCRSAEAAAAERTCGTSIASSACTIVPPGVVRLNLLLWSEPANIYAATIEEQAQVTEASAGSSGKPALEPFYWLACGHALKGDVCPPWLESCELVPMTGFKSG